MQHLHGNVAVKKDISSGHKSALLVQAHMKDGITISKFKPVPYKCMGRLSLIHVCAAERRRIFSHHAMQGCQWPLNSSFKIGQQIPIWPPLFRTRSLCTFKAKV